MKDNLLTHRLSSLRQVLTGGCLLLVLAGMSLLFITTPAWAGWNSLTGLLPDYTRLMDVKTSPDSRYVIFKSNHVIEDQDELYQVPITGTNPLKLNPDLVSGGDVYNYEITTDSQWIVYAADQEVDQRNELYRVPVEGGPALKLNGALPSGGGVGYFQVDYGTQRVVYIADQDTNDVYELYSVSLAGGAPVKLNSALCPTCDVYTFEIDPVNGLVVYSAEQDKEGLYELYSVSISGGTKEKLNQPVKTSVYEFSITPGLPYIVFIAQAEGTTTYDLFVNYIGGGTPKKLNQNLNPGENVLGFRIGPNAAQVVYNIGGGYQYGKGDLWRTETLTGATHQALTSGAVAGYGTGSYDFFFSPDSQRVVYQYQESELKPRILQSVKADGGLLNRVDLYTLPDGHAAGAFRISPDSQWVVFLDNTLASSEQWLYSIPMAGGSLLSFGPGINPVIMPDSQRFLYYQPLPTNDGSNLMSVQIFGGGQRNLSHLESGDYAYTPVVSPDGQWIVFQAQLDVGQYYDLRVSDGSEPLPTPSSTASPTPGTSPTPTPTSNPPPPPGVSLQIYLPNVLK